MKFPLGPREEHEIHGTPLDAHGADGERRAVLVADEQREFARMDAGFQRHGKICGHRLVGDGHAINHARPDDLFADGILGDLRHGERDAAREERFVGLDLHGGDVEIGRAEIEREPRLAGIFVPLGDGDGLNFTGHRHGGGGVNSRAGEGNRRGTLVVHREPQPRPCTGGKRNVQLARAVGLAENRLALRERLPVRAVG